MRRHKDAIAVAGIWLVLTALIEILVLRVSMLPAEYAREAGVVDDAYRLLLVLAAPVFAFTVTMLAYSVVRFRVRERPVEDGPPLRGSRRTVAVWLLVTGLLAVYVVINPGFVGLAAIRGEPSADVVIQVTGARWFWTVTYPNGKRSTEELVVPVDTRIRFDVTAPEGDVLHSFWIPAFRVKIDALPGRVTQAYVTPERLGDFATDDTVRIQCAELCGVGHAAMRLPVRVVPREEFDAYIAALGG